MAKPIVLFLCSGNSARSQMAEAFLRRQAGDRFEVHSAGLEPAGVNPLTVQVMNEIGYDLEDHRSKPLSDYLGKVAARYVVFVCDKAETSCPRIWPNVLQTLSWPFEDPAALSGTDEEKLEKFREVRDEIKLKIESWLAEQHADARQA
ncbi:arsenate reductase ArsC [Mariniblastus fucicola]|uniref:Arsenate-mycothiol transferase ArsC2 n=1 Tax=Mariniblastus fucicola TaxID=980251 RepID=A0A5B9P9V3_9BACT|nr:arsenate reductase ArsC [Mariniblastus fucicola]QEG21732.1 Arsenate-mycothiol transferase ArsC2 [Mariniblastus fucicola]